jgi:hypothetical protein
VFTVQTCHETAKPVPSISVRRVSWEYLPGKWHRGEHPRRSGCCRPSSHAFHPRPPQILRKCEREERHPNLATTPRLGCCCGGIYTTPLETKPHPFQPVPCTTYGAQAMQHAPNLSRPIEETSTPFACKAGSVGDPPVWKLFSFSHTRPTQSLSPLLCGMRVCSSRVLAIMP